MANFDIAYKRTVNSEGGYGNHPNDKGGETYMGISRRAHPNSKIWEIIDKVDKKGKTNRQITAELKKNTWLTHYVKDIYKKDYWNVFELDKVKSQRVANEIFDDAVNRGIGAAAYLCSLILGLTPQKKITKELLEKLKEYGK